ncbi:MFS transporter [Frankia sp. R82]|nr:MFS transporter [Frankia sp. R82]
MLVAGQAVSALGTQMATVAVSYQVYTLTGSSPEVGLVSLAGLGPLLAGALIGGTIVDSVDRRRLLVAVAVAALAVSPQPPTGGGQRLPPSTPRTPTRRPGPGRDQEAGHFHGRLL